jgi:hypothetical protein
MIYGEKILLLNSFNVVKNRVGENIRIFLGKKQRSFSILKSQDNIKLLKDDI